MGFKERMEEKALKRAERMAEEERLMKESAVEVEYNEKGQIKRKGFKMGQQQIYGEEFEEETIDKIYKPAVVFLACFFLLFILAGVVFFFFIQTDQFRPFILDVIFKNQ